MTNMFKKTLVASALFAFAGAAQAATVVGTTHDVTSQYLASTGANHVAADFVVTLGAEYTLNDTITLTFTAPLAVALPTSRVFVEATPIMGVTFSLISGGTVGDSSATYRLTAVDTDNAANTTIGANFNFPAPTFAKANLASGASVSFSAKTNTGLDLDTGGGALRTEDLVDVVAQFTKTAPSFARVIDVETQRKSFVDLPGLTVAGTFNITSLVTGGTTFARPIAGAAAVKHTITGDFSWVVDNDLVTPGLQPKAGVFAVANCATPVWTYSATAVSVTCDAVAANTTVTIDPEANKVGVTAANIPVLPVQTFTATSAVTFTGPAGSENVFDAVNAGSWTLNGSSVYVPYMLYGATAEQTIQLTNNGVQSGDITATAVVGGTTHELGKVGTSNAKTLTSLNSAIRNAMVAKGINVSGTNFAVALTLVTNVPAADVVVYSAYQRGNGDRLVIVNDSNGK